MHNQVINAIIREEKVLGNEFEVPETSMCYELGKSVMTSFLYKDATIAESFDRNKKKGKSGDPSKIYGWS